MYPNPNDFMMRCQLPKKICFGLNGFCFHSYCWITLMWAQCGWVGVNEPVDNGFNSITNAILSPL